MKVAFPTNDQETIASHIGLCKGFLIIDTKTKKETYIENPAVLEESERGLGASRIIPPFLADAGVDVLVSREFSENMAFNLEREGIVLYETDEKSIENALNQLKEEEMREFDRKYGRDFEYGRGCDYDYDRGYRRDVKYDRNFERDDFERGYGRDFGYGCRGRGFGCGYCRGYGRRWED